MKRLPDSVRECVLVLYAGGMGTSTIGQILGINQTTALDIVTAAGINRPWRLTEEEQRKIVSLYRDGFGARMIADQTGGACSTILHFLTRAGIRRTIAEAALLPRHNCRIPASTSFLPLNASTAWLLGLIFSDGSMRRDKYRMTISVGDADADGISKIGAILGGNIRAYKHRANRVSNVQ